ncbi:MAG: endonuclease/exonuclease/phosphatase family protein, partial [Gammaproteobacteria bacterium]
LHTLANLEGFKTVPETNGTAKTFPAQAPTRTLDWVLYNSQFQLVEGGVVDIKLSDHLPVVGRLRLR